MMVTRLTPEDMDRLANEERDRFRRYATGGSEPQFAMILSKFYEAWDSYNAEYFSSALRSPHITCGCVPPRAWGFYSPSTDWGGQGQITLHQNLVWGTHKAVVNPWPALGTSRFLLDVVLHETTHQWQFEIAETPEQSYGGHGSHYATKCNEIGARLRLEQVVAKRRKKGKSKDRPSCAYWPHIVRPDGYYCEDIDVDQLLKKRPKHIPDVCVVFRNLLEMLEEGRVEDVKRILREEIQYLQG